MSCGYEEVVMLFGFSSYSNPLQKSPPSKMINLLKLIFLYAKDYWFYTIIITAIVLYFIHQYGTNALTVLIWFKFIASGIGLSIHQSRKDQELHFYMNNGIGKRALIIYTLIVDFSFWILCMILLIRLS